MRWLALVAAALGLSSCAAPYGHVSDSMRGGYEELQLAPNVWEVRFRGNGYTPASRAADFALLRATEICLAAGEPYILMVGESSSATPFVLTGGGSATRFNTYSDGLGGFTGSATTTNNAPMIGYKPSSRLTIACQGPGDDRAWDAALVNRQLRERHGIDE